MKKKIIVFDLDGVLFDSHKISEEYFLASSPALTPQKIRDIHRGNFHEEWDKFKQENEFIAETPEEKAQRHAIYSAKKAQSPLFDGIKDLLTDLHRGGYVLVINTSALLKNCLPLLEQGEVAGLFDFLATKEVSKSKVEKFKLIAEKYQTPLEELLFITDTLGDIYEAEQVGVPSIAVTWGVHDRSYFETDPRPNVLAIVDSVGELQDFIKKMDRLGQ